jgi:hypothetical protein
MQEKADFPGEDRELEEISKRFARIASKLSYTDLHKLGHESKQNEDDLLSEKSSYFLGYYGNEGILHAFEAYGILDNLREKGWSDFRIIFDLEDPYNQVLRLTADRKNIRDGLLLELIVHEGIVSFHRPIGSLPDTDCCYDVIFIEWLLLQSPGSAFEAERPRLPGQRFPGLGIGREILELLYQMGVRLDKDGIINFPYYYHNAVLYRVRFKFVNPEDEGRVRAYFRDLSHLTLNDASWAFELGCVEDAKTGEPVEWSAAEQILACRKNAVLLTSSSEYREIAHKVYAETSVRVNMEKLREKKHREELEFSKESYIPRVQRPGNNLSS